MEISKHAHERIQGRTKLLAEDVLSIISAGAVIDLGCVEGYLYKLFFDPLEHRSKIAVIAESETHLVSVWETHFALPKGVGRPTPARRKAAQEAYQAFTFTKVEPIPLPYLTSEIEVSVDMKVVYREEGPHLPPSVMTSTRELLASFAGQLAAITAVVERVRKLAPGTIRYEIFLFEPETKKMLRKHQFRRKDVNYVVRNFNRREPQV